MNVIDLNFTRTIAGPPSEVFDVWFDPACPGGPWHGAAKVIMGLAVDGMFYFGLERAVVHAKLGDGPRPSGLLGHFGRFTRVERPRLVEHTWMSEHTHGIETVVSVAFEPQGEGTRMTLVHRGVPDDEKGRRHEGGWTWLLARLGDHFEAKR